MSRGMMMGSPSTAGTITDPAGLGFRGIVVLLVVPIAILIAAIPLVPPRGVEPPVPALAPFAFVIVGAGVFGFVPYILVAFLISIWSWGAPRSSYNSIVLLWPLLVAAAGGAWYVVTALYVIGPPPSGDYVAVDLSMVALLFSLVASALYVYLLVAFALRALIRRVLPTRVRSAN